MRRCLVTRGTGFIGSALVRHLLCGEEDAPVVSRVVVLDKLTYAGRRENLTQCSRDPRFRFVEGDIVDSDRVGQLLEKAVIDSVSHLVAHVDGRNWPILSEPQSKLIKAANLNYREVCLDNRATQAIRLLSQYLTNSLCLKNLT